MTSAAQIKANQSNAKRSSGPTTKTGKRTSSQNRTTHGLCHHNEAAYLLDDENPDKFFELRNRLVQDHQPQTETERILVRRMADHEWLRVRALRLQQACLFADQPVIATEAFALYLRYQTNHERAFYKALNELQKLSAERTKEQIGFEAQKREMAAEQRAAAAHNWKKQEFELKKERATRARQPEKSQKPPAGPLTPQNTPDPTPANSPGDLEMAA